MKTKPALLLLSLPVAASLSAQSPASVPATPARAESPRQLTPGAILSAQVQEILATPDLDAAEKRRQVVAATRLAVKTSTTGLTDPVRIIGLLQAMAIEAASGSPAYAQVIVDAVVESASKLPALESQPDLMTHLREDVLAALAEQNPDSGNEPAGADAPARRPTNGPAEFGGRASDVIVSPAR